MSRRLYRSVALLLAAATALTLCLTASAQPSVVVPGDMNGDGWVDWGDLPGFAQAFRDARDGGAWPPAADLFPDGRLDHRDAEVMVNAVLSLVDTPTAQPYTQAQVQQMEGTAQAVWDRWEQTGLDDAGSAAQVAAWATGQGLAQEAYASPSGVAVSIIMPSGLSFVLERPRAEAGTSSALVRPEDVARFPAPPSGAPKATVLYFPGEATFFGEATYVEAILAMHGYDTGGAAVGAWNFQTLPSLLWGASVVHLDSHGAYVHVTRPDGAGGVVTVGTYEVRSPMPYRPEDLTDPARGAIRWLYEQGYLCPVGSGPTPEYWGFTQLWFSRFLKAGTLREALVFVHACEQSAGSWYSTLQPAGARVVVCYERDKDIDVEDSAIVAKGLYEILVGLRNLVGELPAAAVPADMEEDDPQNLGNAVSADAAWFESEFPARLQALLAGDTYKLEYSPTSAADVALIPHLDTMRATNRGITLRGSFGTEPGLLRYANLAPWPLGPDGWSTDTISVLFRQVVPNWGDPAALASFPAVGEFVAEVGGLKSNPLSYYLTILQSGHNKHGFYYLDAHVVDPQHRATTVDLRRLDGSQTARLDWDQDKAWHSRQQIRLPSPPPVDPVYEVVVEGSPKARFEAQVLGYCDEFPEVVFPENGAELRDVTGLNFQWHRSPRAEWRHGVVLFGPTGAQLWGRDAVEGTALAYSGPPLQEGQTYTWVVWVTDPDTFNMAEDSADFTYQPEE